jgi:hypothetical protein
MLGSGLEVINTHRENSLRCGLDKIYTEHAVFYQGIYIGRITAMVDPNYGPEYMWEALTPTTYSAWNMVVLNSIAGILRKFNDGTWGNTK